MEIIYKNNKKKSNFEYCSEQFKNKKVLNSFNKVFEPMVKTDFDCKNLTFDNEINGCLYLSYPLSVVVKADVKFKTLHELISKIRNVYAEIYKDYDSVIKYGVWGHSIGDLCISGITIYENGAIDVSIDS